jgi:energy-coupling factor transporter ATP-binding protein EcfA2
MEQIIAAAGGQLTTVEAHGGHRLRSLRIVGGFLGGASLDFADCLNCIIGARGSGKTTVIELIRFALDALPTADADAAGRRRIDALIAENLSGGRVELTIETKDGLTFVVTRAVGEEPIVLDADRQPTAVSLRAGGLFAADICSQNEIERIADHGPAQLALIDRFEAEALAAVANEIGSVQNALHANAGQIAPLQAQIDTLTDQLAGLPALEEQLRGFATAEVGRGTGNGEVVNRAHAEKALRDREQRTLDGLARYLTEFDGEVADLVGQVAAQTALLFGQDVGTGPNAEAVAAVERIARECAAQVATALAAARKAIATTLTELSQAAQHFRLRHNEQELAFRRLIEQHQAAQAQAAERSRLERQRNQLLAQQTVRTDVLARLNALQQRRQELLLQLTALRDQRFAIRRGVAEAITAQLAGRIHVTVRQANDVQQYVDLLASSLRNARVRPSNVVPKLVQVFWPDRLAALVRSGDPRPLVDEAELSPDQARKVIDALAGGDTLFHLESVDLGDAPMIELNDNGEYKPSPALSTGQKCTAVLPILLLDSANPLLIDQPEDNLDNRFIFEHVVGSLRTVKERRQLVFVTHNPNIPVLGDAERVFVLDSDGARAFVTRSGGVDACHQEILTLLEGGAEAFAQRQLRYGCLHANAA